MEPAKKLMVPCFSMKDSACIQTETRLRSLNKQGTAAAAASALCEFSGVALDGPPGHHASVGSLHLHLCSCRRQARRCRAEPARNATPRRLGAVAVPPRSNPPRPTRGLLNPVAALFHCGHARRRGRAIRWVPAGPRRRTTGWSTSASVSRRDGQVRSSVAVFSPAGYRLWPSRLISLRSVLGFRLVPVPLFDGAAGF